MEEPGRIGMAAPKEIIELVERFKRNKEAYISGRYNETQLRREFIDPFFKALGWDVDNENGYAEAYKDVIHEDAIKVGGATKAPDYCFRIGGTRKFFVEAKKPSVNLKDDISPAFQLRRYAWSAKLPLSILVDFEELAVYDCRTKPVKTDKASKARIIYLIYSEYPEQWEKIASIFAHEEILRGSFDKYAESTKRKRGTAEVDSAFLKEIENWRNLLARNIALRNPGLSTRELNFAVQRTIDRIIFLRICEDRGVENYGKLMSLQNGERVYQRLCQQFQRADERYNSGLFHFQNEKDNLEQPDNLTLNLAIDDKPLKDIVKNLYYPDSPYEFSVLPAEILGHIYEQFLGKVIRLTPGHRAIVEDKPEVKKAGGVYYTPSYIVDYIVKNTVGKLLEGKTPGRVAKIKILDPACGSGSFLIGAYQYLLDWHRDWYVADGKGKHAKKSKLYQASGGNWRLTTAEKKRILLNNIYGVDIDPQAVEVTKLSLLLKVLEDETQLSLFHERALPDLGNNIKCGNSLIGPDYYENQQMSLFDEEECYRINAFDWQAEFPQIFSPSLSTKTSFRSEVLSADRHGDAISTSSSLRKSPSTTFRTGAATEAISGFDVVIGNPPYVRQETLGNLKDYFKQHYQVYHGAADLYAYFIERGLSLLKKDGIFSYIVANKWMRANYGKPLRQWMKQQRIEEIIDFGDLPVFQKATTYPCILRIRKDSTNKSFDTAKVKTLFFNDLEEHINKRRYSVRQKMLDDGGWSLAEEKTQTLLSKLQKMGTPLGDYVQSKIYRGILTGLNEAFVIDSETRDKLISEDPKSAELIKPFLLGRNIKRYQLSTSNQYLIFTRHGVNIKEYPAIEQHLSNFKERLMPRPKNWKGNAWKGRKPGSYQWYEIQDTIDYYAEFERPKIMLPDISIRGNFTIDNEGRYHCVNTAYIILSSDKYLLGILNSALITFYYKNISSTYRGGYLRFIYQYLEQLPIRTIDFSNPDDKKSHDKMIKLVEQMLALHKQLSTAKTDHDKTMLKRQITATDHQINQLVFELYGLTEEEIEIIEGV